MVLFCLGLPLDSDFLVHFSRPCEFSLGGFFWVSINFPLGGMRTGDVILSEVPFLF